MTLPAYALADVPSGDPEDLGQLNVEPSREGSLWKVIIPAIRCPICGSTKTKAETGKRTTSQGLSEHYRSCPKCQTRFRVVFE